MSVLENGNGMSSSFFELPSPTAKVTDSEILPLLDPRRQGLLLFCCYCHKDENLRNQLEIQLRLLQRQGVISSWHDRLIGAGQEWKAHISRNLEQADIILLLVSADFIASDYCYDIEMTRALERHRAGTARVIPVIVRDVNWCARHSLCCRPCPEMVDPSGGGVTGTPPGTTW